jgi:uncharacterized protein YlxW (UPF0749 family)
MSAPDTPSPRPAPSPGPATTPEPATEPAAGTRPTRPTGSRRNRFSAILIGLLLAILGFGLAVQLQSNSKTDSFAGAREDDLIRILDDQNSRIDRLQQQISDLQQAKQRLTDSGSSNAAARQEAQKQADALAVLTGTVAAHGPGVDVTITDPGNALKAEDLLDIVEELRGAGAEVIQFGPVRVGVSSAFTDNSDGVQLDHVTLASPYEVKAIGDPQTLDTALNITGGVVNNVHSVGGSIVVRQSDVISITAVRANPAPKFAQPVGK